jgi:nucleoside-diphosphate-sugar epimerase
MSKKIHIFGGNGFIGLHLQKRFKDEGFEMSLGGDVTKYDEVAEKIKDRDVIINLATVVQTTGNFDATKDLEVNLRGQINILEARKNINPTAKYIYISSSLQFGKVEEKDLPIKEDYPQRPLSLYGINKSTAENYCLVYKRAYNLDSIILRLPPVYGPSLDGKETRSIIEKFIKIALRGESFNANNFGLDLKDQIYVDDVVEAIVKSLKSKVKNAIYNLGSGLGIKLIDISKMIIEKCGVGRFEAVPYPADRIQFESGSFYFDISKAKAELGWSPRVDIKEGIKRMVKYYKNQK